MQYCTCKEISVVLVEPMEVSNRVIFKDVDFNIRSSSFLHEVVDSDAILALNPSHIIRSV